MLSSTEIRRQFIEYFTARGHTAVPSAPVVPRDDPTLLFTNAGMNQFKDVFLGQGTRPYTRAVDAQKVLRVSGKHNDLEEVGVDTYHHTFFEMLGNWSFGDYYKREAIEWAWDLLTNVWRMPKDKLYATVYEEDDEAEKLWKEVTDIEHTHISRWGKKDNFWEMGDVGPCGPCSEIHFDRGVSHDPDPKAGVNTGSERFIEIWNLVFIQYNRDETGTLTPLPAKHVDTGMGFERLCAILQNALSNYDTDVFQPLIMKVQELSGVAYESGVNGTPHRVLADHVRAVAFAIADGALPGNEGRGYVLRRLLRRAARYARQLNVSHPIVNELVPVLDATMGEFYPELRARKDHIIRVIRAEEQNFSRTLDNGIERFENEASKLKKGGMLSGEVAWQLYDTYGFPLDLTELMAREKGYRVDVAGFNRLLDDQREKGRVASSSKLSNIVNSLIATDFQFQNTMDKQFEKYLNYFSNMELSSAALNNLKKQQEAMLRSSDLITELIKSSKLFEQHSKMYEMITSAKISEPSRKFLESITSFQMPDHMKKLISELDQLNQMYERVRRLNEYRPLQLGEEERNLSLAEFIKYRRSKMGESVFVGYDFLEFDTFIRFYRKSDDKKIELILAETPFYPEGGGQLSDTGIIKGDSFEAHVYEVKKTDVGIIHFCETTEWNDSVPELIHCSINKEHRIDLMRNHTATHLLNQALRIFCGHHIHQAGSLVHPDYLRFDFTHYEKVPFETVVKIEKWVNERILDNLPVVPTEEPMAALKPEIEAGKIEAMFDEKYGDVVRVVRVRDPQTNEIMSQELCGGTHVSRTIELGYFAITTETGAAAGVRRIEAVTGRAALERILSQNAQLVHIEEILNSSGSDVVEKLTKTVEEKRAQEKAYSILEARWALAKVNELLATATVIGGVRVISAEVEGASTDTLKTMCDAVREHEKGVVVVLGTRTGGSASFAAAVTEDLLTFGKLKAGDIVRDVAKAAGGGGGGKAHLATAGAKDPSRVPDGLAVVLPLIGKILDK